MGKPKIDAKEALDYIRAGLDDHALMEIFNLSAKGLQSLFKKLMDAGAVTQAELDQRMPSFVGTAMLSAEGKPVSQKKTTPREDTSGRVRRAARPPLDVREVLRDIKSGNSDGELMEKYRLSSRGLQHLFDQLVEAGAIAQSELDQRMPSFDATVDLLEVIRQLGLDQRLSGSDKPAQAAPRCPACGAAQTIIFDECTECGAELEWFKKQQAMAKKAASAEWKCPSCGKPWTEPHEECPHCGVVTSKLKESSL